MRADYGKRRMRKKTRSTSYSYRGTVSKPGISHELHTTPGTLEALAKHYPSWQDNQLCQKRQRRVPPSINTRKHNTVPIDNQYFPRIWRKFTILSRRTSCFSFHRLGVSGNNGTHEGGKRRKIYTRKMAGKKKHPDSRKTVWLLRCSSAWSTSRAHSAEAECRRLRQHQHTRLAEANDRSGGRRERKGRDVRG